MKQNIILALLLAASGHLFGQSDPTGTYRLKKGTASCTITIKSNGTIVNADVFAWAGSASGTHGVFRGSGPISDNFSTVKPDEPLSINDDCSATLEFSANSLKATFSRCEGNNIYADYSGKYEKTTSLTAGMFFVVAEQSFFYTEPKESAKSAGFVVKGKLVNVQQFENKEWVYADYTNEAGKSVSGYMRIATLTKQ